VQYWEELKNQKNWTFNSKLCSLKEGFWNKKQLSNLKLYYQYCHYFLIAIVNPNSNSNCRIYGWGCFSDDSMDYRMLSYPVKFLDNSECYPDENRNYVSDDLCIDNSENVISTLVSLWFQQYVLWLSGECQYDCLLTDLRLSGDCLVTVQWVPGDCSVTIRQLIKYTNFDISNIEIVRITNWNEKSKHLLMKHLTYLLWRR
jgi:hypothetical protein